MVALVHLRAGGTSIVLETPAAALPRIVHWGPDLGDLSTAALDDLAAAGRPDPGDSRLYVSEAGVLPLPTEGWLGRPGLTGSRGGRSFAPAFADATHDVDGLPLGGSRLVSTAVDTETRIEVATEFELHPSGLLRVRATVINRDTGSDYVVDTLTPVLPVPAIADELSDFAGRHTLERRSQRRPFQFGMSVREAHGGRPGHDSATVLCAGRRGFGFRSGRVWGVHVAHSGDQVVYAERTFNGWRLLGGGELLGSQEVTLGPGRSYSSPWLVASWGEGLDRLAARFHRFLRARPSHPSTPRPVVFNTWEAVYRDLSTERLQQLADRAARLGAERFVIDDGWFHGRRSDTAGLGDWFVDGSVFPAGLQPIADHVRSLGLQLGLWVEPEMVNLDSDLARAHPEWLFDTGHGPGLPSRKQHVLDLAHPDAFDFVLERISALVGEYAVDYLKWDHNRPVLAAGHQPLGTPGVHAQTEALYALLDELRRRHPGLEIESCCGGGARIDLGILEHTDRVWASDCIDAHDRLDIQRGTSALLPPELVGTHIGSTEAHGTLRVLDLDFRAGVALWGHLGIEWDIGAISPDEEASLQRWIAFHRRMRPLLHSGTVVHADLADDSVRVEGVVADDLGDALFLLAAVDRSVSQPFGRVPLPGLDPDAVYHVRPQAPGDGYAQLTSLPGWLRQGGVQLPGRVLEDVGLDLPPLHPDRLLLVRATRLAGDER